MTGKQLEIISQIVLWYKTKYQPFCVRCKQTHTSYS